MVCFPKTFLLISLNQLWGPNPWCIATPGLGSFSFARHYSRNRFFFLFLWVLRCFSSPRSLLMCYFTYTWIYRLFSLYEFPHSDIPGYNGYVLLPEAFRSLSDYFLCMSFLIRTSPDIMDMCSSPRLFAAYHVLRRLLVPRHSPYALSSLTYLSLDSKTFVKQIFWHKLCIH